MADAARASWRNAGSKKGEDIEVIPCFNSLHNDLELGYEEIEGRSDFEYSIDRGLRNSGAAEINVPEKRELHLTGVCGDERSEGVRGVLQGFGSTEKRKLHQKRFSIRRPFGEEIEVDRGPVSQAKSHRGSAIENEPEIDGGGKQGPKSALGRGQHFEMPLKCAHAIFRCGMGGTGRVPYSARPRR